MINKIKSSLTSVDYILHVADIHIRNWKRHKEYKIVFNKLFDVVEKLPPNSIVTVGGDIVHAKTDMSPELIHMVSYFFKQLADKVPTIVITGNHDTNLNNNNRLDALTPIIEANKHPNLFYLRDSGIYQIGDLAISVMSLLDDKSEYPTADKIQVNCSKKIAMYHGTIANSKVDSGLFLTHGLDWDTFAGFDIVLLGDIHKRQVFSESNPMMFYPGSLIQQSFGESYEGHGYALVDVKANSVSFHDISNPYGFYTVEVDNGILLPNLPISSKTSVRLKTKNTNPAQLKTVLADLRKLYGVSDVVVTNLDKIASNSTVGDIDDAIKIGDVRNQQVQSQLISEYFKDHPIDEDTLQQVLKINEQLNQQIVQSETVRGVVWKPKKFEFNNMFSYGEGNVIDFSKLNGTSGLFAANHAGKSSILDALCFCLFDHTSRAGKAEQVLNNKSDWFSCKFNFELNGLDYFIEKRASRYAKGPLAGRLRVDIDFWVINEDGEKISLNGEQRRDTDKIIQSYVGTFDDFVLTALSLQGNNSNFVEKTQSERKDLLANFLDLSIFDQLYDLANKEYRTASILLENYQKQDLETILGDAERKEPALADRYAEAILALGKAQKSLKYHNDQALELNKQLLPCRSDGLDITKLNSSKQSLISTITREESYLPDLLNDAQNKQREYEEAKAQLDQLDTTFDTELYATYKQRLVDKVEVDRQLSVMKMTVTSKLDKLDKLSRHKYDPNCSYCVNNIFVKDAIVTKTELEQDKLRVANLLEQQKQLADYISQNAKIQQQAEERERIGKLVFVSQHAAQTAENTYQSKVKDIDLLNHRLDKVELDIKTYNEDVAIVENNKKLNLQLKELADKIAQDQSDIKKLNIKTNQYYADIQINKTAIDSARQTISHMQELVEKLNAYEWYCKAMYKDGIPYALISRAVPFIQNYVNNILSQVVDFVVTLETDGKNINAFIGYDGNKWPLELASGMERFISSLAIRIALIKSTNLPKPDFMAIDEGLGVLDSSNLNSMHMFFTYMKDIFRFSLIISHIDVVRDMVDTILTIDRKDDFSHINC